MGCRVGVSLMAALMILGSGAPAWGYRPLITTDADVVEPQEVEIEFGYFTLERTDKENTFVVPHVVMNYGLFRNWELSAELLAEKPPGAHVRFVNPAVFLKSILKEGMLQNTRGMSLAVEAGLLLPSADPEQKRVGLKGIGVLSGGLPPFTYHLNLGGGVDREKTNPFILWGAVAEWSMLPSFRLVGEINSESIRKQSPDTSALVGVIWQSPWSHLMLDGGIRKGISREASDWSFTIGLTWNFSFPLEGGS